MSESFDPYYEWLGIPPEQQPPTLYQLLGLQPFEENQKVISNASDKQMEYFHKFKSGKHVKEAQRILTEVSKARLVLLDPTKKNAYDASLHQAAGNSAGPPAPASLADQSDIHDIPLPTPAPFNSPGASNIHDDVPLPTPAPYGSAVGSSAVGSSVGSSAIDPAGSQVAQQTGAGASSAGASGIALGEEQSGPGASSVLARRSQIKKKQSGLPVWMFAAIGGGALCLLLAIGGLAFFLLSGGEPQQLIIPLSQQERVSIHKVLVNGQSVQLPQTGDLAVQAVPGPNTVHVERTNFEPIDQQVNVGDENMTVRFKWSPLAKLILDWPLDDRRGGALEIDGASKSLSTDFMYRDDNMLEFAVAPGPHTVAVRWADAAPFDYQETFAPKTARRVSVRRLPVATTPEQPGDPATPEDPSTPESPAQEAVDLLALIDVEQHFSRGTWRKENGLLYSPAEGRSQIVAPYNPSESFVLTAKVTRKSGAGYFGLCVERPNSCVLVVDGADGSSGIHQVDSQPSNKNETTHFGELLLKDQTSTLICTVKPDEVMLEVDDKQIFRFQGAGDRLSIQKKLFQTRLTRCVSICAQDAEFEIEQLTLQPLQDGSAPIDMDPTTVIAQGTHKAGRGSGRSVTFYSNGSVNTPMAANRWTLEGDEFTIRWASGWIDTCKLDEEGVNYLGNNQDQSTIRGNIVSGNLRGAVEVATIPPSEVTPEIPEPVAKVKPPSAEEYQTVTSRIVTAYGLADITDATAWREAATQMLRDAKSEEAGSANHYALLRGAMKASAQGGDVPTAMAAVDQLGDTFDLPIAIGRAQTFLEAVKNVTNADDAAQLSEQSRQPIAEVLFAGQGDMAKQIDTAVYQKVLSHHKPGDIRKAAYAQHKAMEGLIDRQAAALAAFEKVRSGAGSDSDKTLAADWLWLAANDLDQAKTIGDGPGDQVVQAAITLEMSADDTVGKSLAIAEAWSEAAKQSADLKQAACYAQAADWANKALASRPSLGDASRARSILQNADQAAADFNDPAYRLVSLAGLEETKSAAAPEGPFAFRSPKKRGEYVVQFGGDKASEAAVINGIKWLVAHQYPDGGWSYDHSRGVCAGRCRDTGNMAEARSAATAMALLALLGSGHTHKDGDFQKEVQAGLRFLVAQGQAAPGAVSWREKGGKFYSHGLAAMALCEAYGMTGDRSLLIPAQGAVNYIVASQDPREGGWRYDPRQSGDTSVTGWQVQALLAAKRAELTVPDNTLRGVTVFLDTVHSDGGRYYGYTRPGKGDATTAVGLYCRMAGGGWPQDHVSLQDGMSYILGEQFGQKMYFNYYATLAFRQYGGDYWTRWNKDMKTTLLRTQVQDDHAAGSWFFEGSNASDRGGRLLNTALAVLCLESYYRYPSVYAVE